MSDVPPQHSLKMTLAKDERPVQALPPDGPYPMYIFLQLNGLYMADSLAGMLLDAGWALYYIFMEAAALHPSMAELTERSASSVERGSGWV